MGSSLWIWPEGWLYDYQIFRKGPQISNLHGQACVIIIKVHRTSKKKVKNQGRVEEKGEGRNKGIKEGGKKKRKDGKRKANGKK